MSSFIGHSWVSIATYAITQQWHAAEDSRPKWPWIAWLLVIASLPDIDYRIAAFRVQQANQTLRITHSCFGALLIPVCTILGLWLLGHRGHAFKLRSLQVVLVGLSHLILDLFTGVSLLPLLYPLSMQGFKLPFGLLPSAGRIQLTNYFLYRNLFIELGVLVPLSISLLLSVQGVAQFSKRRIAIAAGLIISIGFMIWASTLSRQ